jgi:hypothetical protein
MKWHEAIALFLIILLAATAANLFTAWLVKQQLASSAGNTTLGKLLGLSPT